MVRRTFSRQSGVFVLRKYEDGSTYRRASHLRGLRCEMLMILWRDVMNIFRRLTNLKGPTRFIGAILGLLIMVPSGLKTESEFAKVHYPGADFGGVPLTFDLQLKQDNLTLLENQNTLNQFVAVQYWDIGIIVGTFVFFTFLTLLLITPLSPTSIFHRLGRGAVGLFMLAPLMDALENLSILTIIAYRTQYDLLWLSFLNSSFTLGKIGFFYLGWLSGGILLIRLAVMGLQSMFSKAVK